MQQVFVIDGKKCTVKEVVGHKTLKQSYGYKASYVGRPSVDIIGISQAYGISWGSILKKLDLNPSSLLTTLVFAVSLVVKR